MSFAQPVNSRGRRHDPDQEGKRQVPLAVTNPVFSQLIKLGQKEKKTPVAMAQALFEEAYAARCLGKSALPEAHPPAFPCQIGVGSGDGSLFVHGSHEAIMAVRELVGAVETLIGERDAARRELDELRRVTVWAPSLPKPAKPEPPPAPPGKGTVRAVLTMRGLGAVPAEIAKELALRPDVVRQVLKEAEA